jgi:RNA-splicing ligase RtcB
MLELTGKYNTAKVFTDNIDATTISQIINLLNQPFVADSKIRIMPDCHAGAGCVIGTTMTIQDKIVPNLVGVDIGCGMLATKLEETEIDLKQLDETINRYVPSGFNVHDTAKFKSKADKIIAPIDIALAFRSLGTLGGGNHFIELDRDDAGALWLVIHTGSRHLGLEVAHHYQELGYKNLKQGCVREESKAIIESLKAQGKEKEIQKTLTALHKNTEPKIPKDLCYVDGSTMDEYLHDMYYTQNHAKLNRKAIADIILDKMGLHMTDSIETIHNYIDIEHKILRKGSVSACAGERLIIPINMRDGSLLCTGHGNPDWNNSAPHGAGRILSRSEAKDKILFKDFEESMKGIYSTSVVESTIDESPMAYKPLNEIIRNIKDTVNIDTVIKPIYNFKAH